MDPDVLLAAARQIAAGEAVPPIEWVALAHVCFGGTRGAAVAAGLARLAERVRRLSPRVEIHRWVRYAIELASAPPAPAGVHLTPLSESIVTLLHNHPDAAEPTLRASLRYWDLGIRGGYVWLADGRPLCFQWLLTARDNPALRRLGRWAGMYPPLATGTGQVEGLWAFSDARRGGVATRFELALYEQARRQGLQRLITHIGETNIAARQWAARTGWTACGVIVRYFFDVPGLRLVPLTLHAGVPRLAAAR
jgi:hypothetical protein